MMRAAEAAYDACPLLDDYGESAYYPHTIHGHLSPPDQARQKPPKPRSPTSKRPSIHTLHSHLHSHPLPGATA